MHTDLLNSWKEIADYLGRGVRTVQRWEVQLQLPVRRAHMHPRSSVTALKSDIDLWVSKIGRNADEVVLADVRATAAITKLRSRLQEMRTLSSQMRYQLKNTMGLMQRAHELAAKPAPDFPSLVWQQNGDASKRLETPRNASNDPSAVTSFARIEAARLSAEMQAKTLAPSCHSLGVSIFRTVADLTAETRRKTSPLRSESKAYR